MTSLPLTYSKIAESPVGSEIAMWPTPGSPLGRIGAMIVNGSFSRAVTASFTVAKESSTYCVQQAIDIVGLPATGFP